MKNVLLLIHDDVGQEARLQAALDVTRAIDGHVHCLDVTLMPAAIDCPYDRVGQAMILDEERAIEHANRGRIEARLKHEDVAWTWQDALGDFASCMLEAAGLADVIILSRMLDSTLYPDMRATAARLLVKCNRPIIAVPETARGFPVAGTALVAWDGSPACAASLRAAVPLLRFAQDVILLEIDDGSIETEAEDAARYLSNHGIHARLVRDLAMGPSIGGMLLRAATTQRADYVVMGAYGHGRMTEALFGGVTRTMLSESPVPLFLAH